MDHKKLKKLIVKAEKLLKIIQSIKYDDISNTRNRNIETISRWIEYLKSVETDEQFNEIWREIQPASRYILDWYAEPKQKMLLAHKIFEDFWNLALSIVIEARNR